MKMQLGQVGYLVLGVTERLPSLLFLELESTPVVQSVRWLVVGSKMVVSLRLEGI